MRRAILAAVLLAGPALAQQPRIDSIDPPRGPIAGGTVLTVKGANLAAAPVTFGGAAIAPLSRTSDEVTLRTPPHDNGYVLLQIGGAAVEFLYVPPRLQDLPPGHVTTVAGVGKYVRFELPATQSMVTPSDLTLGSDGDIYFMQTDRGILFRVDEAGILHHVAGTLDPRGFEWIGDGGPAREASFAFARSVAVDGIGNAYITDIRGRIRKVDAKTGIVTTVAGTGEQGFSGDGGPATQAMIGQPTHIACLPDGTLYFLDALPVGGGTPVNLRVRKVSPSGTISTVAGNGSIGDTGDGGPAVAAPLNVGLDDFGDLAVDAQGNVFILEYAGARIRRVDAATGVITTFASLAFPPGDGRNIGPSALAIDAAGNVHAGTSWNFFKWDGAGHLLRTLGNGHGFSEDGTQAVQMKVGGSLGLAVAQDGDVIYSDITASRVRKIEESTGRVATLAGMSPDVIGVPGDPLGAVFVSPAGDLAFLPSGELIFSDAAALRIYRLDLASNTIVPFAGTGQFSGCAEGARALDCGFYGIALDVGADGRIYVADKATIRAIDHDGSVHRVAGLPDAQYGFGGDGGAARDALLCQPGDVVLDAAGNVFIADTNNNRIRRVDALSGIITTVAGSGPSNGFEGYGRGSFCGDGGPALSACFNTPVGVVVSADGSMVISDFYSEPDHKVRKVGSDGRVSTLPWPLTMKLAVGPGGSIFGHGLTRIYRADHDEARTLLGDAGTGFAGDGRPASEAKMGTGTAELAQGLAIDAEGNLFFHDAGNCRIRAIRFGAVLAPPGAGVAAGVSGTTIMASVRDAQGRPASGVRVEFQVPGSGATCTPSATHAITDAGGVAGITCTPNCRAGTFTVRATALGAAASAYVTLTNADGPCRRRAVRH